MDTLLKFFIGNHLFYILALYLFSNGPEGLILLPISVLCIGFELCLITGLINELLLKNRKKGAVHLWSFVFLTTYFIYEQLTRSPIAV